MMTSAASRNAPGAIREAIGTALSGGESFCGAAQALLSLFAVMAAASAFPMRGMAEGVFTPYAAEDIEHNTNIFDLPKSLGAPLGKNGPTFADTTFTSRAGVEALYNFDQQQFFGTAEFRHLLYENFTDLDHNEELFDGGLKWRLSRAVDGSLEYRHEQRIVQFQDLAASTQLILETSNDTTAAANVAVTPEWRVESTFLDHELGSPRVDIPGLSVHEDSLKEGLKYLGVANLAAGAEVAYLVGRYNDDPAAINPKYHQESFSLAATYVVSGLTNFTGSLGYTRRTDDSNAAVAGIAGLNSGLSGLTGNITYQHSLTAKTSVTVQLGRALNTYVTTGGNEIDTTAGFTVNYQATYKILVRAGYAYTSSKFPSSPDGAVFIDRSDHLQYATLDASYQVLHWLSIRPYAKYQSRNSNESIFTFNGSIVGIELLVKQPRVNR